MASSQVNLYEAKTQLSHLVERASHGEEIIIAKAGKPMARLIALPITGSVGDPPSIPFGQNLLGVTFLSENWEDDLPLEIFNDPDEDRHLSSQQAK